jgi:hypothetical protein
MIWIGPTPTGGSDGLAQAKAVTQNDQEVRTQHPFTQPEGKGSL